MIRAALFSNYTRGSDIYHSTNRIGYQGQARRATFDRWFVPTTEFHLFRKQSAEAGWAYVGPARVTRRMRERTENDPPMWELEIVPVAKRPTNADRYVRKEEALTRAGLVSKYECMSSGIIPLF